MESLVVPHLDYCFAVYFDASSIIRTRLQRLANAGVRYIFGVRRDTRITPYRRQLGWLRNDFPRDYFALLLMYRIVRMKEPPFFIPLFKPFQWDRPIRGPRKDLDTKKVSSDSFQGRYAHLWNSNLQNIRDLPSYSRFKGEIRRHLFTMDA